MEFLLSEIEIPVYDGVEGVYVTIWFLRGNRYYAYPTKIVAETACRRLHPEMSPDQRYSLIYCKTVPL